MDSAAAATKAVSRLVLLDGRFDRLPSVVAEGRRVVANIERVSVLFLAKTVYAVLMSLTFGVLLWGFPFLPRQLSVLDGLTIGLPAFFLALMANPRRYRPGFLARSLRFAVPAGAVVAGAVVAVHLVAAAQGALGSPGLRTASVLTLALAGLWVLVVVSRPLDLRRLLVIIAMYGGLGLILLPPVGAFLALHDPPVALLTAAGAASVAAACGIELIALLNRRHPLEAR
jgi:cation-transporting ATPase E